MSGTGYQLVLSQQELWPCCLDWWVINSSGLSGYLVHLPHPYISQDIRSYLLLNMCILIYNVWIPNHNWRALGKRDVLKISFESFSINFFQNHIIYGQFSPKFVFGLWKTSEIGCEWKSSFFHVYLVQCHSFIGILLGKDYPILWELPRMFEAWKRVKPTKPSSQRIMAWMLWHTVHFHAVSCHWSAITNGQHWLDLL